MSELTFQQFIDDARENGLVLTTRLERIFLTIESASDLPEVEPEPPVYWYSPVGTDEYPSAAWYVSVVHDLTGKSNNGYAHSGIDLNVARYPYGDVDRGQPVFAMDSGVIANTYYHPSYLGGIVVEFKSLYLMNLQADFYEDGRVHSSTTTIGIGDSIFTRYWHLENNHLFKSFKKGQSVEKGQPLGNLGNYTGGDGGDHLHLDMAVDEFFPTWWFTHHPEIWWVNPLNVLNYHLGVDLVDLMISKELG